MIVSISKELILVFNVGKNSVSKAEIITGDLQGRHSAFLAQFFIIHCFFLFFSPHIINNN